MDISRRVIQYMTLYVWFLSLSTFSSFIHIVVCISISFLLLNNIPLCVCVCVCVCVYTFYKMFIHLFIFGCAGLCCCTQAFSSFSKQGLLSSCRAQAAHCGGFPCCGAWAQWLWHMDLVVPWHVGAFQTRDRTHGPLHWQLNS